MKKKYLALGLCVILSLSACGGQKATQEPAQEPDQKVVQQTEPAPQLVQVKAETPIEPVDTVGENVVDEAGAVDEVAPVEEVEAVGEVELFTPCEETVYATGEVNIRASWTSSSDKLGSLARGDSVTRIGNSIAGTEAEGWSMVKLSDGSIAYIHNNYLSLTKPAPAQAPQPTDGKGSTGGSGGSDGKTDVSQPAPSQPSTGQQIVSHPKTDNLTDGNGNYRKDGLTEEEARRKADKSAALLRGEGQLLWDENGNPYYVY